MTSRASNPYKRATTVASVLDNLERCGSEMEKDPATFKRSISSVKTWYAGWIRSRWRIGFSKFVGYNDMTAKNYRAAKILEKKLGKTLIDGGKTDLRLFLMSVKAAESTRVRSDLDAALKQLVFEVTGDEKEYRPKNGIRIVVNPINDAHFQNSMERMGFRERDGNWDCWSHFQRQLRGQDVKMQVGMAGPIDGPWYFAHGSAEVLHELDLEPVEIVAKHEKGDSYMFGENRESALQLVGEGNLRLSSVHYSFENREAVLEVMEDIGKLATKEKPKVVSPPDANLGETDSVGDPNQGSVWYVLAHIQASKPIPFYFSGFSLEDIVSEVGMQLDDLQALEISRDAPTRNPLGEWEIKFALNDAFSMNESMDRKKFSKAVSRAKKDPWNSARVSVRPRKYFRLSR